MAVTSDAGWNPEHYLKFGDERTRPAQELAARIAIDDPLRVIDLGCGPGNSTRALKQRWPDAQVAGLDNSEEMIAAARKAFPNGDWVVEDIGIWWAEEPFEVVFSNAALQWLPDHEKLFPRVFDQVARGGALAVQMPAHYASPLHENCIAVSMDVRWSDRLAGARDALMENEPAFYYDLLSPRAAHVDIWETEYQHIMANTAAIMEWFCATGLRPFLGDLDNDQERKRFKSMLSERYEAAYPQRSDGRVLMPFRRLFVIAYR